MSQRGLAVGFRIASDTAGKRHNVSRLSTLSVARFKIQIETQTQTQTEVRSLVGLQSLHYPGLEPQALAAREMDDFEFQVGGSPVAFFAQSRFSL